MSGVGSWSAAALLIVAAAASPAAGQSTTAAPGRLEIGFGLLWIGNQSLGSSAATEPTASGGSLTLFSTTTDLKSRAGLEGRVGVKVWRSLEAEASGSYMTPSIQTQITGDFEGAAPKTAVEQIQQYTVSGGIVWYLPLATQGPHLSPFVTATAGYLRQLHEGSTLAETGQVYQVGGGVKYLFASSSQSRLKGLGVRVDARAVIRSKGVAFDDGRSTSPALSASLYARF